MSKFKPVATRTLPAKLLDYLNSEQFALDLIHKVLYKELRIEDPMLRPAEHYVQEFDPSIEVNGQKGIELTLSKVSVKDGRSFNGALKAMRDVLVDAITRFVPTGQQVQIFCVISTDVPVLGTNSTLFEMEKGEWIEGAA